MKLIQRWSKTIISLTLILSCLPVQVSQLLAQDSWDNVSEQLYLDFNNETVIDKSAAANNVSTVGEVSFIEGVKGKGIQIKNDTGSSSQEGNNYLSLDEAFSLGNKNFSISFWYKSETGDENGGTIFSSKNYNSGSNPGFSLGSFTNEIRANFGGNGQRKDLKFSTIDNMWHHNVVSVDRSGMMRVFNDGVFIQETNISTMSSVSAGDGIFRIGADGFKRNSLLNSMMDEIHIYEGILNDQQVASLYRDVAVETEEKPADSIDQQVLSVNFDGHYNDNSAYQNSGIPKGALQFVDGIKGKALHIVNTNGSTNGPAQQYVSFKKTPSLQFEDKNFSITYWYRADNGVSNGGALISNKDFDSGSNAGFNIGNFDTGFRFNFTAKGGSRKDVYNFAPIDGIWHKVTVNVDRSNKISAYLDGKKAGDSDISSVINKSIDVSNFVVGADGLGNYGVNDAYIDELEVYKKIIDEQSILNSYLEDRLQNMIQVSKSFYEDAKDNTLYDTSLIQKLSAVINEAEVFIDIHNEDKVNTLVKQIQDALEAVQNSGKGVIPGQVLYLPFDENNANDYSGRENHGVENNVTYTKGISGTAVEIKNENGSSEQLASSFISFVGKNNLNFGNKDFAIGFWYKSVNGGAVEGALFSNKDWSSGNNIGFTLGNFSNGLRMNFTPKDSSRKDVYNIGANDDVWHYVVLNVERSGSISAYVDNALMNQTDISSFQGKSIDMNDLIIGADGVLNYGVDNVLLDEVRIFTRTMSNQERNEFYYPVQIQMELKTMEDELTKAKQDDSVSKEKIDIFEKEINDFKKQLETADYDFQQEIKQHMQIALDYFHEKDSKKNISFQVLSDVHVEGSDPNSVTVKQLKDALKDIAYMDPNSSAVVFPGDITNGGSQEQYTSFFDIIDAFSPSEPLVALGNHDVRWLCDSGDRNEASIRNATCKPGTNPYKERYLSRNKKYMKDTSEDQLYFDRWIDGYHFITLNTEEDLKDQAYLSIKQLDWLDKTLAKNASEDKPIFIQVHQTLKGTADHEELDLVGGESEIKLKEVLSKYPQSVIFTGHVHNGVDIVDTYQGEWGHLVDVPCYWYSSYGSSQAQVGYQIEVNGSKVKVRLRDFKNNVWMPEYDMSFDVKDKLPLNPIDPSDSSRDIDVSNIQVIAGNEQATSGSEGPANNLLDNDSDTIWHTSWNGTEIENLWVEFIMDKESVIDGIRYLPRQNGSNGSIKKYRVEIEENGVFKEVAIGKWKTNASWKIASFKPVKTAKVRIYASEVVMKDTLYASGAEMRLTTYDNSVYKESLQILYDKVNGISAKDYTINSWKKCLDTLEKIKVILDDPLLSEEIIMEAQEELQNAFNNLQLCANKTTLIELLKSYDLIVQNKDKYEQNDAYKKFINIMNEAMIILNEHDVLQIKVDEIVQSLQNAFNKISLIKDDPKTEEEKPVEPSIPIDQDHKNNVVPVNNDNKEKQMIIRNPIQVNSKVIESNNQINKKGVSKTPLKTKKNTVEVKKENSPKTSLSDKKNANYYGWIILVGMILILTGFVGFKYTKRNQK